LSEASFDFLRWFIKRQKLFLAGWLSRACKSPPASPALRIDKNKPMKLKKAQKTVGKVVSLVYNM
jgi:hypothetical protein